MARSSGTLGAAVIVWLLVGCGHNSRNSAPTTNTGAADTVILDERLGVDDVFTIRVTTEPDLTGEYRVAADGTIDFPYAGRTMVAGMTPGEIQSLLIKKLKDGYLRNPQISVMVKDWNSRKITILGQVTKPGAIVYFPKMTVMDAIAAAGGFTPLAAPNSVKLRREINGRVERATFRVGDISEGRSPNVVLLPRDVLVVEERLF